MNTTDTHNSLTIKDFEIVKELGTGSFGRVRLVKKREGEGLLALKSVMMNRLSQKEKESALNQVRLLASISIPTVIKYEGSFFNSETNELCILMEYADGGDLQNKIMQRSELHPGDGFEEKAIWKVAYELLTGLKGLHKHNIIHRDIKSANVFFAGGVAKLGDMNVSKLTEDGFASTQTGTPYYTAPQIWNSQKYGKKCDVWSLGCLIYELCTLRVPFKAQDFPSLFRRITKGQYSPMPEKYSKQLHHLVQLCLTTDQEIRPSAAELLDHSLFQSYHTEYQHLKEGEVSLVQPIKCPKVLRFLNSRLPKPNQKLMKKTVGFAVNQEVKMSCEKENGSQMRRIRSEKVIKWSEDDAPKAPRNLLKLPSVIKETPTTSHKHIAASPTSNGLHFSTKKLKMKPTSTKIIMGPE